MGETIEGAHRQYQLRIVLWSLALVATVWVLGALLVLPLHTGRWLKILFFCYAIALLLLWGNRRGYTRPASWALVVSLWVLVTFMAPGGGGIRAPLVSFYIYITLVAGLLLGRRIGVATGVVCVFSSLGLAIAEAKGLIQVFPITHTPVSLWVSSAALLGLAIFLQNLAVKNIEDAFRQAQAELAERRQLEGERQRLIHDLGERVKELTTIQRFGQLLQAERPFDQSFLTELAALLPPGWQYPEVCEARIRCGAIAAATPGWRESPWIQSQPFATQDGATGRIEVVYLEERPAEDEGPFLAEERNLLQTLATMLANHLERRSAQEELRQSEEKYRALAENASDILYQVDIAGNLTYVGPQIVRYGYNQDEIVGHNMVEFIHPEDRDGVLSGYQEAMATGREILVEFRIMDKKGHVVWFEENGRLLRDQTGQVVGNTGVLRDISERKQAEEAARVNLALQQVRNAVLQMQGEQDWSQVVRCLYEELAGLIKNNACSINLVDIQQARTTHLQFYAYQNPGADASLALGEMHPALHLALATGQYVYRPNRKDPLFDELIPPEINSVVDVPFSGGTLALNSLEENAFSERDIRILEQFAQVLSEAHRRLQDLQALEAERKQAEERQQWNLRREEAMGRIRDQILRMRHISEIQQEVGEKWVEELRQLSLPIHNMSVQLPASQDSFVVHFLPTLLQSSLYSEAASADFRWMLADFPWVKEAWETGKPVVVDRPGLDKAGFVPEVQSLIEVPLPGRGSLGVNSLEKDAFDERAISTLETFAGLLATALQRLEDFETLSASEERFRLFAEKSPLGIAFFTPEGENLYINPTFEGMFGYTLADLSTWDLWFERFFPDPQMREEIISTIAADVKTCAVGEVRSRVYDVTCKDGSVKTINFRALTMEDRRQFVLYEDITARALAEKLLRREQEIRLASSAIRLKIAAMEEPEDLFGVVEEMGRQLKAVGVEHDSCTIQVVNAEGTDFVCVGATVTDLPQWQLLKENMAGTPWGETIHFGNTYPWVIEVWKTGKPRYDHRAGTKDEPWLGRSLVDVPFLRGTLAVNSEKAGAFSEKDIEILERFAHILSDGFQRFIDITRRRHAEALVEKQRLQAVQVDRLHSLGEMAAGVAHELNQPLMALSTIAEDVYLRLSEGLELKPEQLREMMRDELGMVERMGEIIEQLRIFARDTAPGPGAPFSLDQVVQGSLRMIGRQLQNHGIHLELDLAPDLPQVLGHVHQLEQVVLNLLSNARDALDERQAREKQTQGTAGWKPVAGIRTERGEEGRAVRLVVWDRGGGIAEAILPRLFEPFATTKEVGKGTGLGLPIAWGIAEKHGGRIEVDNRPGEGASFIVTLPAWIEGEEGNGTHNI